MFRPFFFLFVFFLLCVSHAPASQAATVRELYESATDAYNHGQYDQAVELYGQINKVAPHFAPAYVGIGLALKSNGADSDEVLYYYKTATEMDPANAQAIEQLGHLYYSLNRYDKAEKSFLKALSIDPRMGSAKLALGWIYLLARPRPEAAIKYFREALKSSPTPNAYLGLGMAYFANNDRVEAMEMITQLRNMKREDFANRLEQMVRDNQKVALTSPDEVQIGPSVSPAAPDEVQTNPLTPESVGAATSPPSQTGMKVRLRGKLSDLNY